MTFQLGARSRTNIARVHPDLVLVLEHAIERSAQDFGIPEKSWRTVEEQREKVRQGVSKTMHSNHIIKGDGFGWAVDVVPWINGAFTWDHIDPFYEIAEAMRSAASDLGVSLTWGCVWDRRLETLPTGAAGLKAAMLAYNSRHPGRDFNDFPHYQLES